MIHEYAMRAHGGTKGIMRELGFSYDEQGRSANNLAPLEGGRYVKYEEPVRLDLTQQGEFIAALLRAWIGKFAISRA